MSQGIPRQHPLKPSWVQPCLVWRSLTQAIGRGPTWWVRTITASSSPWAAGGPGPAAGTLLSLLPGPFTTQSQQDTEAGTLQRNQCPAPHEQLGGGGARKAPCPLQATPHRLTLPSQLGSAGPETRTGTLRLLQADTPTSLNKRLHSKYSLVPVTIKSLRCHGWSSRALLSEAGSPL